MKTILIVEDSSEMRENVREILSLSNYNVITAENGKEGLEKVYANMPDLIISDIMMPVVDGFGMLHVLKNDPKTEVIPFIFLTAKTERNYQRDAMDLGADDFISKPFNGNELLRAVENRFKKVELFHKNDVSIGVDAAQNEASALSLLLLNKEVAGYSKREIIFKEGKHPFYLYYIKKGKVMTFKTHEDGKNLVVGLFNEGDFLGYIPVLEKSAYLETAEAIEDSELVLIPVKEFQELLIDNQGVKDLLIKMLAKNFTDIETHILGIAYNTLRKKVAEALSSLYRKYMPEQNGPFTIDLSRDELAALAGTATESLIRTLHEFKNESLLDIIDGKVIILKHHKLEHLLR